MKKIIVRADDLGFSESVNYGIEKTVKQGIVKSVGVMMNMEKYILHHSSEEPYIITWTTMERTMIYLTD